MSRNLSQKWKMSHFTFGIGNVGVASRSRWHIQNSPNPRHDPGQSTGPHHDRQAVERNQGQEDEACGRPGWPLGSWNFRLWSQYNGVFEDNRHQDCAWTSQGINSGKMDDFMAWFDYRSAFKCTNAYPISMTLDIFWHLLVFYLFSWSTFLFFKKLIENGRLICRLISYRKSLKIEGKSEITAIISRFFI